MEGMFIIKRFKVFEFLLSAN